MKKARTARSGRRRSQGRREDRRKRHVKFWRRYLRLTRAGVLALRAFELIRQEEQDDSFRQVIAEIIDSLREGRQISRALAAHESEFSRWELELIRTAEKRGAWDEVLQELCDGLEDGTFD